MGKSKSIRTNILVAFWGVITGVSLLFASLLYQTQKSEFMAGVDNKLITGAEMARMVVGERFHDSLSGKESLPEADYRAIVDSFNKIALTTGFQYLWSNLLLDDGRLVFTTATSKSKKVENGDYAGFFTPLSDPEAFQPVLENGATSFSSFENQWGSGRMVLIPYKDALGRTYVFGASISTKDFAANLSNTAKNAILVFFLVFVAGTVISLLIAQTISKPIKRLDRTAREIAAGRYGQQVKSIGGSRELVALAETVNLMSGEIQKNHGKLEKVVETLETTQHEPKQSHQELEKRVAERTQDVRYLTQAVEQSPHMVMITDLDGTIVYVNRRFSELTGYSSEEAVGKNPRLLQSGDTSLEIYENLWSSISGDGLWSGEIKDRRKNGEIFWASATIALVKNDNGEPAHYVAIHEDISERKKAEASIRVAMEQAETASRAKSEMLANMSHEFRTPLNAIIGFSDTILSGAFGPIDNEKYREYIDDIHRSGTHLLELINDVLDVSAIEAGKIELREEITEPTQLVDSCIRLIQPRADRGAVKLTADIPSSLPPIEVDIRRMKQALLNLLSNAVKFTPNGGNVTASVVYRPEYGLDIVIADTGIGMSPEELEIAKQEFGQVDSSLTRKFEGTGLGLTLTQGLIDLHGGQFRLESSKGVGTVATITLPKYRVRTKAV